VFTRDNENEKFKFNYATLGATPTPSDTQNRAEDQPCLCCPDRYLWPPERCYKVTHALYGTPKIGEQLRGFKFSIKPGVVKNFQAEIKRPEWSEVLEALSTANQSSLLRTLPPLAVAATRVAAIQEEGEDEYSPPTSMPRSSESPILSTKL
jgi:hypothetical protein